VHVLLTGGTSFLGSEVARLLVERGDRVRAVVRDGARAQALSDLGCELVEADLGDEAALFTACRGVQAVVHGATLCELGVSDDRRADLVDTNVCGTERMLGAALAAGVQRAVYVSTVAVFGDTGGRIADETWTRDPALAWSSAYEETTAVAHGRAQEIAARGLPLVIVQPGAIYGAGARSALSQVLERFLDGRLPLLPFPELGVTPVHRDDAAAGVVLALDKGVPGESYVLGGTPVRTRELMALLAEVSGRSAPSTVPTTLLRALSPLGRFVGPPLGLPPNLRELISCADGVTFWAGADRAADQLGWTSRPLREGLSQLVDARRQRADAQR